MNFEEAVKKIKSTGMTQLTHKKCAKESDFGYCNFHKKFHKYSFIETVSFNFNPRFYGLDTKKDVINKAKELCK